MDDNNKEFFATFRFTPDKNPVGDAVGRKLILAILFSVAREFHSKERVWSELKERASVFGIKDVLDKYEDVLILREEIGSTLSQIDQSQQTFGRFLDLAIKAGYDVKNVSIDSLLDEGGKTKTT